MNGIFLPMLYQGLYGLNRRLYDGGRSYPSFQGFEGTFSLQLWAAGLLLLAQLVFIVNFVRTLRRKTRADENPGTRQRSNGRRLAAAENWAGSAVHRAPTTTASPHA